MRRTLLLVGALLLSADVLLAREPIKLANNPALSPDGKTIAFDYAGDVWTVPVTGGIAKPLTSNPARDRQPKFSPDGKEIAFVSDREGSAQVFVMPALGGTPEQVTFHTAGYVLQEWTPEGRAWLVSAARDHYWNTRQADRFFQVRRAADAERRPNEELLFDDYGHNGTLSPDGRRLLFTREGPAWWRKGYHGSQSYQIWLYDRDSKRFTCINKDEYGALWPLWKPDGDGFYYVSGQGGCYNLWEHSFHNGSTDRQITKFTDDSVTFPCISRDGSTIVFRHLFDLYRLFPGRDEKPVKIDIERDDDRPAINVERRVLTQASSVAFTSDGLEVAFIAGGDLWVMDTELREPKRVTTSVEEERSPIFTPDGGALYFVSDMEGKTDIWKATRADGKKPWFLNDQFKLEKVTSDGDDKSRMSFSPDGSKLAYVRGRGDLWVSDLGGKNAKKVIESWNAPSYDWSPDGKWLVYALFDNDFNRDIWIKPVDGSRPPFDLSRHPYHEDDPVWSPNGRIIAFVGARDRKEETDIHFVYLRAEDAEKSSRDRTLEKALEKLQKGKAGGFKKPDPMATPPKTDPLAPKPDDDPAPSPEPGPPPTVVGPKVDKSADTKPPPSKTPTVIIDWDGIHDRIRRVTIPNSNETDLLWSPDSKKLAFTATVNGQVGTYTIEVPENLTPSQLSTQTGSHAHWLKSGQIVWLSNGIPGGISGSPGGSATPAPAAAAPSPFLRKGGGRPAPTPASAGDTPSPTSSGGYRFTAYQDLDLAKRNRAAFEMCWRVMRDTWYDERLGNRDWSQVRDKYVAAAQTADQESLATVVQLMLGELNGSHLGFVVGRTSLPPPGGPEPPAEPGADRRWHNVTAHLGVRFVEGHAGPGLKIRDVISEGPADQKKSKLRAGEVILEIDGKKVDPAVDLTHYLNGLPNRDIRLMVADAAGKERGVTIRPIGFLEVRRLLYRAWLKGNLKKVEEASKGTLGYLHISAMDMPSFHRFEEELYNAGAGKDGLIIDVRENGGGSTTDHLLTALTQPRHAIAVPRGGGPGYPQDRTVYATWNKPIVVLCNQNSFSNAEIFSHAIKTLKRGHLVGVPTAGGVISTGGTAIMDIGFLRLPARGWFVIDNGEDMELHGATPDHILWPEPGEMPQGKDVQLAKGVEVLLADVKAWKEQPQPRLQKATERR
jgi:tricorn protease